MNTEVEVKLVVIGDNEFLLVGDNLLSLGYVSHIVFNCAIDDEESDCAGVWLSNETEAALTLTKAEADALRAFVMERVKENWES